MTKNHSVLRAAGYLAFLVIGLQTPLDAGAGSTPAFEVSPLNPTIHVTQSYKMESVTLTALNPPGSCSWTTSGEDYYYWSSNTTVIIGKNYWTPFPKVVKVTAQCGGVSKTSTVTFVWQ